MDFVVKILTSAACNIAGHFVAKPIKESIDNEIIPLIAMSTMNIGSVINPKKDETITIKEISINEIPHGLKEKMNL